MATETLADTRAEDGVQSNEEVREEKEQSEVQEKEKEENEENEGEDFQEKSVSLENEENEGKEKEGDVREDDSKEEKAETKKGKRSRKQGSGRGQREVKKSGQESTAKKAKVLSPKEPATPNERPTRERKTVERYSEPLPGRVSASKALSIEKGSGTQLKDIPNVAFKLSKKKPDDNLQILHTILFGKKAKIHALKRNIGQFSGYVWVENEEEKQKAKIKEKLDKCIKEKLVDFCDVLNIPINKAVVRKEEISAKLLEFLESPHATTDVLLADKEQKGKNRKRKVTPSKSSSPGEASTEKPVKKRIQTSVGEKQKPLSEVEGEEASASRDDSDDVEDNDTATKELSDKEESKSEEEEEEKREKKTTKKASSRKSAKEDSDNKHRDKKASAPRSVKSTEKSAKKSSISTSKKTDTDDAAVSPKSKESPVKKRKIEKESQKDQTEPVKEKTSSKKRSTKPTEKVPAKDQGKSKTGKKAKPEPSREEMHAVVVDILKQVDFNTATLSDILRQLGTHFDLDLMHRKAEVKGIITDVINSMSDDEDEEEAEENAEAGNDADDKDVDEDGNGDDEA